MRSYTLSTRIGRIARRINISSSNLPIASSYLSYPSTAAVPMVHHLSRTSYSFSTSTSQINPTPNNTSSTDSTTSTTNTQISPNNAEDLFEDPRTNILEAALQHIQREG